jgi:hypothetical protein
MEITVEGNELSAKANTGNKQWVAVITGTHPQYNYEREFVAYQKPKTSNRDSGSETVEDGAVVEYVRYTHSGKNRSETHYQVAGEELHQIDEDDVEAAFEEIVIEVEEEIHECEECGDEFGSEHGLAIHKGMVHGTEEEEEEEDETPTKKANSGQRVVADGGVEYDDYEIDPTELEYDTENGWRDSTNSVSNTMSRIKGSDLWVCYRSWQTGPSEFDHSIKGLGDFTVEAVELDHEFIVEQIREEADEVADIEDLSDFAAELKTHAPELAEKVAEEWAFGVEELVGDAAYDGYLNHDGTFAWVSHVEEAYYHETKHAIKDVGIEDTPDGIAQDAVRAALSAAVNKHCDRWRNPHAEYIGRLKFEVEAWELRALELNQNGVFGGMMETARVQALRETGKRPSEIADILDVNPSTVTRHKTRADEWLDRAHWTVENVTEKGVEATR